MSKKKFLSACIIARDSEEDIAWCLEGLEGEVDEIIVVDTGSEDRTKEIARRYTKQVFVKESKLHVQLTSAPLRQNLMMEHKRIAQKLNEYVGSYVINDVCFF